MLNNAKTCGDCLNIVHLMDILEGLHNSSIVIGHSILMNMQMLSFQESMCLLLDELMLGILQELIREMISYFLHDYLVIILFISACTYSSAKVFYVKF